MEASGDPPPTSIVDAFGATGRPIRMGGGYGGAWRAGEIVLKRAHVSPGNERLAEAAAGKS